MEKQLSLATLLSLGPVLKFSAALKFKKVSSTSILLVLLLLLVASLTFSSQSDDTSDTPPALEDPDWIRLEIPAGREAYAVAGSLNKTLLVSTWTKAYYTTDQGKTWQESKDFQGPVMGLFERNDTTFALQASSTYPNGEVRATLAQYYTTNYGKSWQYITSPAAYEFYSNLNQPIGKVKATNVISYQIKNNVTPVSPGAAAFYTNPSELLKTVSTRENTLRLPKAHKLLNLSLDASNRLYVAASGGTFTKENNNLYCCEDNTPAIIYVSRKPLP